MRRKAFITLGILFAAIQLFGAGAGAQMRGALVTDLTFNPNDSLLVRAAKMTVASRASMTMHSSRVIDNDSLRQIASTGHFAVGTTEVQTAPTVLGPSNPAPASPYHQQQNTQYTPTPAVQPSTMPRPFSLPPPPPPTNPTPYRPPQ
ncbi:MAG TPA: hypothetical protein VER58_11975 [Thermoanaerobaculia bacterium]|nr:hypothetical protein [Thermoanaerobaculia bacterium]